MLEIRILSVDVCYRSRRRVSAASRRAAEDFPYAKDRVLWIDWERRLLNMLRALLSR